jgi:hypothetical protein
MARREVAMRSQLLGLALAVTLVVSATPVPAQDSPQPDATRSRIFPIRHADVEQVARALRVFGEATPHPDLGVIAIKTSVASMPAVEDALRLLDARPLPRANVELRAHLVIASQQPEAGSSLPPELRDVAAGLGEELGYASFRLLDTIIVRTLDGGSAEADGLLPAAVEQAPKTSYRFRALDVGVNSGEEGQTIHVGQLVFEARFAVSPAGDSQDFGFQESSINTEVELENGRATLIGKAIMNGSTSSVLLIARVTIMAG